MMYIIEDFRGHVDLDYLSKNSSRARDGSKNKIRDAQQEREGATWKAQVTLRGKGKGIDSHYSARIIIVITTTQQQLNST